MYVYINILTYMSGGGEGCLRGYFVGAIARICSGIWKESFTLGAHYSVFRCVYTATHCNTLQHTATHCNTLQHTATHCNTLQHAATHCNKQGVAACYNVVQCVAMCCSVLRVAVCCSVFQCIPVCFSVCAHLYIVVSRT